MKLIATWLSLLAAISALLVSSLLFWTAIWRRDGEILVWSVVLWALGFLNYVPAMRMIRRGGAA